MGVGAGARRAGMLYSYRCSSSVLHLFKHHQWRLAFTNCDSYLVLLKKHA